MNEKSPKTRRIERELSPRERALLDLARAETAAQKDMIIAQGKAYRAAMDAARQHWTGTVAKLKSRREELGVSLADIEAKTGLKRSALSRLENDAKANPTLLTIMRYANALGLSLTVDLHELRSNDHVSSPRPTRESA